MDKEGEFLRIYNQNNDNARRNVSYIERKIFAPITHEKLNDPTNISFLSELPYFACSMHDGRAKNTANHLLEGLDKDEFDILKLIVKNTAELTDSMGLKTAPKDSLLRHLYQYRQIKKLFPKIKSIIEIGPGSGYLSLILALNNYKVISFDICQALYIFQHYLYKHFGVLNELAVHSQEKFKDNFLNKTIKQREGRINHIPWWVFNKIIDNPIEVDLITINHAVCELHPYAITHLLSTAEKLNFPRFFLEGTGDQSFMKFNEAVKKFSLFGYKLSDSSVLEKDLFIFEKKNNSKLDNLKITPKLKVIRFSKNILRLIPFMPKFLHLILQEFQRINNEFRILKQSKYGKKVRREKEKYYFDDILKFYDHELKCKNFLTPNENFAKKIGIINN